MDAVFFPSTDILYPEGYSTFVEEEKLSEGLCGVSRPRFFKGVTTIVLKLFNLVRPEFSVFGLKDAQQFFVIEKMVRDLNLQVRVEGAPTVRECDGLAMSSRNRFLSAEARKKSVGVFQGIEEVKSLILSGYSSRSVLESVTEKLQASGLDVQYLECRKLPSFELISEKLKKNQSFLIAFAGFLDGVRLIDNIIVAPEKLQAEGFFFV